MSSYRVSDCYCVELLLLFIRTQNRSGRIWRIRAFPLVRPGPALGIRPEPLSRVSAMRVTIRCAKGDGVCLRLTGLFRISKGGLPRALHEKYLSVPEEGVANPYERERHLDPAVDDESISLRKRASWAGGALSAWPSKSAR